MDREPFRLNTAASPLLVASQSGDDVGSAAELIAALRERYRARCSVVPLSDDVPGSLEVDDVYRQLFDVETSLPGSVLLRDRTEGALARARRANSFVLVVWLELRRAGSVDRVVVHAAQCVCASLRPDDVVARISDYELVVVCNEVKEPEAANAIVRRLANAITQVVELGSNRMQPLARIGTNLATCRSTALEILDAARRSLCLPSDLQPLE